MMSAAVLLFVIMGQSNAVGVAPFPSSLTYAQEARMHVYGNDAAWHTPAREPLDSAAGQVDAVSADPAAAAGFALPMVDAILAARPNDEAIIVPCAKSGSSITEWQRDLRRDTLYGSCLARTQEAMAQWQDQTGVAVEGVTVAWWQGEVDSKAGEVFNTSWAQRFARLRSDWRADVAADAKFVVAVLKPNPPTGYPAWLTIRNYQIAARANDPLGLTEYFGTGNVPYDASQVHPTLAGYQILGAAAATAYLRLP